jgi:hypothetical protein
LVHVRIGGKDLVLLARDKSIGFKKTMRRPIQITQGWSCVFHFQINGIRPFPFRTDIHTYRTQRITCNSHSTTTTKKIGKEIKQKVLLHNINWTKRKIKQNEWRNEAKKKTDLTIRYDGGERHIVLPSDHQATPSHSRWGGRQNAEKENL